MKKKNARQPEQTSANKQRHFAGTDNPRHLRVLQALMRRSMPREEVDRVAGASNGPDLIFDLRGKGLEIPCAKVPCIDRDGIEVERGIYALSALDRRQIARWLAKRSKGVAW
ncbi:hypothetical protein [Paraburkholderia sp. J63]|uniref:hypothetical protein n=1 Tax=Paraburkholderia sp. J63 TaxID=2805434 RepID=UPI002ABD457B|nr:hypothetical protein [Paraburkholderia sp. J63]